MRVGKLVAIFVLGGAVLSSTALAAPGKLIDTGVDDEHAIAFATGDALRPNKLLIRVSATPVGFLEVLSIVTCAKGKKKVKAPEQLFILFPTAVQRLKQGYKKPTDCTIDVQAAYQDPAIIGDIKVEIFARGKHAKKVKK